LNNTRASTESITSSFSKDKNKAKSEHNKRVLGNLLSKTYPEMEFIGFGRHRVRVERRMKLAWGYWDINPRFSV
jgi:hypothetical protein